MTDGARDITRMSIGCAKEARDMQIKFHVIDQGNKTKNHA